MRQAAKRINLAFTNQNTPPEYERLAREISDTSATLENNAYTEGTL